MRVEVVVAQVPVHRPLLLRPDADAQLMLSAVESLVGLGDLTHHRVYVVSRLDVDHHLQRAIGGVLVRENPHAVDHRDQQDHAATAAKSEAAIRGVQNSLGRWKSA